VKWFFEKIKIFIDMNRYQKAAKISNDRRRKKSIDEYYLSPNICKYCGEIIKVKEKQKVSEVRKKYFCNQSCSAIFNNPKREKLSKEKKDRQEKFSYLNGVTKKKFFELKGVYYKFRAVIRKHAQYVYEKNNGSKVCSICGYDKHIQVCHIKSVSSFKDDDLITDINSKNNLIGLCPNHHWEYDNGYINL
jgi:hypothetical protein